MVMTGEASMKRLSSTLKNLLHVPEYLVPPRILDLAEKFDSCGGWGLERAFQKWALKQDFRACLPEPFVIEVPKVKPAPGGDQTVKIGMFLPHMIMNSLYEFRSGELFYSLMAGTPHDYTMYWEQDVNKQLARDIWGEVPPRAVPFRLYGDGADVLGCENFEMLSLVSVCGAGKGSMDSRFVICLRSTVSTDDACRETILRWVAWSFRAMSRPLNLFSNGDPIAAWGVVIQSVGRLRLRNLARSGPIWEEVRKLGCKKVSLN
ncbi:unnamed protein product [Durusdinium trenchii]|uniref:Uncharacterized protein n=1 Tax=Durusdinium trenchii TaxID=1381693 RepID=A0ABP0J0F7_9DINO